MEELRLKICRNCGKEFESVFKEQHFCYSCMDKIFENEKQISKPIMADKIIDFIKEVSNDKELNNPYCLISIFDSHVNFCIYICNRIKDKYLCGGHMSFCTLKESKSKTLFDLYELNLQLNKLGIKLVVDFNWFIDS